MDEAQELRMQLWRTEMAREDVLSGRPINHPVPPSSSLERQKKLEQLAEQIGTSKDPKNESERLQNHLSSGHVEALLLFDCLREELLIISDKLRDWVRQEGVKQRLLAKALERLGTSATREFLPDLVADMDRSEPYRFAFVGALASLARDEEKTVRELVERVRLALGKRAINPLQVLRVLGPRAAELVPSIFSLLMDALENRDSRTAAIYALGTIGSENEEWGERIAMRLLELSRTDDVWQKGAALWALGDLKALPDQVVPRLIEAFDDYEEPDPDYNYGSSHTFVTRSLQAFGPLVAPAVPALLARLRNDDGELDSGVIATLGTIGPVAAEFGAVEALEDLARPWAKECNMTLEELLADDENVIGQALRAIRGF